MRPSLYKILISSTLTIPLSFCFSHLYAETPLTQESILDANGVFSSQSTDTAGGTVYSLQSDISIMDVGQVAALNAAAFVQTVDNLTFNGNNYSFSLQNVNSGANVTGINVSAADKILTLSDFSSLSFRLCPPDTVATGKGAMKSGGALNLTNNANVLFDQNFSAEDGGAIACKAFTLTGSSKTINFTTNKSAKKGGAIAATGVANLSDNQGTIEFSNNAATNAGGAVLSEASMTIARNGIVVFKNNRVSGANDGCGGAIHCSKTGTTPTLTLTDNKALLFKENTSSANGGAICSDKFILSSGGPTLFIKNKATNAAPKGGAIQISGSGECSITAELGNITFEQNSIATANNATVKANAINIGNNGKFLNLRAADKQSIFFYDPITCEGACADLLTLNKAEGDKAYTGRIIFSGEKLTEDQAADADNLKTVFSQPIALAAGQLVLRRGVDVEAKTISQTAGSIILVDAGTKLHAKTEDVTLTGLAITPGSLDGNTLAEIAADANAKNLTLSGPIQVIDASGKFYEEHKLDRTLVYEGIRLSAKGAVTLTDVPSEVPTPEAHYGYQGNWSISWAKDTTSDPKTSTAIFTWKKTGYKPNPERQAPLVLNTLWGSFVDVRSIQEVMERSVDSMLDSGRGLWVSGISNFFHQDRTTNRKFRHISAGYALGATANTSCDNSLSVAFCQLFGKDKDYLVAKNASDIYAGSLYYQHVGILDNFLRLFKGPQTCCSEFSKEIPILFDAQLTYSHANNNMKTDYTDYPRVKATWGNDTVAAALSSSVPFPVRSTSLISNCTPFAKLQVVYAHLEEFKEPTTEGRTFESCDLINVSVPIGLKFEKICQEEKSAYDLTLMYTPDVYRHNPSCLTTLAISDVSWETTATDLDRHALAIRAGNHIKLTPSFEMFGQFAFELRSSSRNYNVDLGTKIAF